MSLTYSQRAKRWNTSVFAAEWFVNTVQYCHHTREGKKEFEAWVIYRFGPLEGRTKIRVCREPARVTDWKYPHKDTVYWNTISVDLGVSDKCLELYHQFASEGNKCSPERIKPAPKRRRGESSAQWLARRHAALLEGCKVPNFDWDMARAIAISELDKVRDTMEVWRTQPEIFFQAIQRRGASTIPSPEILERSKEYQNVHTMDDAVRTLTYIQTMAHMTWFHATELFEDLARMGLTTTSSIEHAYKKDRKLMWRLVSCFARVHYLLVNMWGKLIHTVTWSEHFRPYFKRWRTANGVAMIVEDDTYISRHGADVLTELVIKTTKRSLPIASFFDFTAKILSEDPSQASKFSAEAFDDMGDVSIVQEFLSQGDSPFGQELLRYALALDKSGYDQPDFLPQTCFMNPANFVWETDGQIDKQWGNTSVVVFVMGGAWNQVAGSLSMMDAWKMGSSLGDSPMVPLSIDMMWYATDQLMWQAAKALDRPGQPGRVAKELGLINPYDLNRPTYCEFIFRSLDPRNPKIEAAKTPAPVPSPYTKTIPVAAAIDSPAQSGHAFLSEKQKLLPKDKAKTRGRDRPTESVVLENPEDDDDDDDENGHSNLPESLPTEFKMGKKTLKVFHRLLESPNDSPEVDNQKKGQIRWRDFENAMTRIGFAVVQTAGSSVRFDPPAQTARPITFHRPHPDSLLTPHMIKWVGARLKRCYGWTTASFERDPQPGE